MLVGAKRSLLKPTAAEVAALSLTEASVGAVPTFNSTFADWDNGADTFTALSSMALGDEAPDRVIILALGLETSNSMVGFNVYLGGSGGTLMSLVRWVNRNTGTSETPNTMERGFGLFSCEYPTGTTADVFVDCTSMNTAPSAAVGKTYRLTGASSPTAQSSDFDFLLTGSGTLSTSLSPQIGDVVLHAAVNSRATAHTFGGDTDGIDAQGGGGSFEPDMATGRSIAASTSETYTQSDTETIGYNIFISANWR